MAAAAEFGTGAQQMEETGARGGSSSQSAERGNGE